MTCCFLRKMLMFGVKHPVILFEVSASFFSTHERRSVYSFCAHSLSDLFQFVADIFISAETEQS